MPVSSSTRYAGGRWLIQLIETRRTYRAVLSEPRLVIPDQPVALEPEATSEARAPLPAPAAPDAIGSQPAAVGDKAAPSAAPDAVSPAPTDQAASSGKQYGKKRGREEALSVTESNNVLSKKKKKKNQP